MHSETFDTILMQREASWYHSTAVACPCGETFHLSVMYGVPMPCSHQYSLGVETPSVPRQYNLSFTNSWSECVLDIVTIEREVQNVSLIRIACMKDLAMRNIKRFSQSKRKTDIKVCVGKNSTVGSQFALRPPHAIFHLISEGIAHVRK
jgi:hypothetical protein